MFTVYVFKSERNEKRYAGYSSKTAEQRLREHNSGTNTFTRHNKPFQLVYIESYPTKTEATKRELFLKSGREFLDRIIGPLA